MSAFIVADRTICQVITWLHDQDAKSIYRKKILEAFELDTTDLLDCAELAQAMADLNHSAVRQRYEGDEDAVPPKFEFRHEPAATIQVYKSLNCWLYQCSEGDIPETSILYAVMKEISHYVAREIVCGLSEYKNAAWDWRSNGKTIH